MDMLEEYDHPSNYRLGEEDVNTMGMDREEECPSNHRLEDEGIDREEERPSNHRLEVEGIDREDIDMMEVVEREHKGMLLVRHWIDDGVERHQQTHQKWEELAKSECLEGHITFASQDFNCSVLHKLEKSEEESENRMKCVWNELKPWGGIYRAVGDKI
jgi:hypothetical protein